MISADSNVLAGLGENGVSEADAAHRQEFDRSDERRHGRLTFVSRDPWKILSRVARATRTSLVARLRRTRCFVTGVGYSV